MRYGPPKCKQDKVNSSSQLERYYQKLDLRWPRDTANVSWSARGTAKSSWLVLQAATSADNPATCAAQLEHKLVVRRCTSSMKHLKDAFIVGLANNL